MVAVSGTDIDPHWIGINHIEPRLYHPAKEVEYLPYPRNRSVVVVTSQSGIYC
jgi:hypothetical protein